MPIDDAVAAIAHEDLLRRNDVLVTPSLKPNATVFSVATADMIAIMVQDVHVLGIGPVRVLFGRAALVDPAPI